MPIGKLITATIDERKWNKKAAQIRATTISSSVSLPHRLSTALSIKAERSYTVTISTPSGNPAFSDSNLAFTPSMVVLAFSPKRITTTPPTTSPSPFSSATPRRICGPRLTTATSAMVSATPFSFTPSGICRISCTLWI